MKQPKLIFTVCLHIASTAIFSQNYADTYAGDGAGYEDGDTSVALFRKPVGMCADASGNIFIVEEGNHTVRKITPDGIVSTLAGNGEAGYADGDATSAQFNSPFDLCVDDDGNIYVSDFLNQRIRKISPEGVVSTIAGSGIAGYLDASGVSSQFNYPRGIVADDAGNIFVSDSWNHRIRKIDVSGEVTTFAGGGDVIGVSSVGAYIDASDTTARFYTPCGLSIDEDNNIYVADAYNHRIRKINTAGLVITVAGSGLSGSDTGGFLDGTVSDTRFNTPTELYVHASGNIYVSDTYNNMIRLIDGETVSTIAGNLEPGYEDGYDSLAAFRFPRGLYCDPENEILFVNDYTNHAIRKIYLNATVSAVQGENVNTGFSIYPNPADEYLQIQLLVAPLSDATISLYDVSGKLLTCNNITNEMNEIKVSHLPAGLYIIKLHSEKLTYTKQLMIL